MEFFFIPHKWEGKYNFFQFFLPYYGSLVELYLEENVNFDSTPPPPPLLHKMGIQWKKYVQGHG